MSWIHGKGLIGSHMVTCLTGKHGGCVRSYRGRFRGQIFVLFIMAVTIFMFGMALVFDMAGAYTIQTRDIGTLENARQYTYTMLNPIKYNDDGARYTADLVCDYLKKEKYSGTAEIWTFEVAASELPSTQRLIAVHVELTNATPTVFGQLMGIDDIKSAAPLDWTINPYSSDSVWRPNDGNQGWHMKYIFDGKGSAKLESNSSLTTKGGLPKTAQKAIEDAKNDLG